MVSDFHLILSLFRTDFERSNKSIHIWIIHILNWVSILDDSPEASIPDILYSNSFNLWLDQKMDYLFMAKNVCVY